MTNPLISGRDGLNGQRNTEIVLRRLAGRRPNMIARDMGLSIGTVAGVLSRSLLTFDAGSPEHRAEMSLRGREHAAEIGARFRAHWADKDAREAHVAAIREAVAKPEAREKMRAAAHARYARSSLSAQSE